MQMGNFEEKKGRLIVKSRDTLPWVLQKRAEPIKMPFGMLNGMSPGNCVLDKGAHWHNLTNTTEPSMCGGDAALLYKITLTTCHHNGNESECA